MTKADILEQFQNYLIGQKMKHRTNFSLLLKNPRPIPEHTDFFEALETELKQVAYYEELLSILDEEEGYL
tara:strand:- start:218 stop:427 length:210 start_codon:yes stop_codon:yes gene_type:complete